MPPDKQEYFSEKKLREIVRLQFASKQLEAFEELKSKFRTAILCPKNLLKIAKLRTLAS
jgi:hypothetical protein